MFECIIFDLDGTLVDSEPLCNRAFLELLPELQIPVSELVSRFRGRKLTDIFEDLEGLLDRKLPNDFETIFRSQVEKNFETSIKAFPNVVDALNQIEIPVCVASSGPNAKIQSALNKTGLDGFFASRTFSSYDIGKWKPDPGLFLHAASEMGVRPGACLVIEDSIVGIAAAKSAGMTPLHFCHDASPIQGADHFGDYLHLPRKLKNLARVSSISAIAE